MPTYEPEVLLVTLASAAMLDQHCWTSIGNAGPGLPAKNSRILLQQSLTSYMVLEMAATTFQLEKRQQSFPQ